MKLRAFVAVAASVVSWSCGTVNPRDVSRDDGQQRRLAALAMTVRGTSLTAAGRYREAFVQLRNAAVESENVFGPQSIELANALNQLGVAAKYAAEFDAADAAYHRALQILGRRRDAVLQRADLYHNLGGLEHARRRFAVGEPYARRALAIRAQALGPDSVAAAADKTALAALLEGQRKFLEAELLYREALATFECAYGSTHYEVGVAANNLASLYQAQRRFDEAEPLYLRSLAIKESLLPAGHPDIAIPLNNLAVLYKSQKRYGEAAALYVRALTILERALGPSHPSVVICRENYARLQKKIG
jgi:tetratricopeptide (TPR) repeat protein